MGSNNNIAMAFPFLSLKSITPSGIKKKILGIGRRDFIFLAFLGIAGACVALLVFDGYLFYTTVTREPVALPSAAEKRIPVSGRDIDEVIQLLDARDRKFNEILNGK